VNVKPPVSKGRGKKGMINIVGGRGRVRPEGGHKPSLEAMANK
jgi:hypothetical protein